MPGCRQQLEPWLRLARISNLPTCWSNVLVGAAVASSVSDHGWAWWAIGMVMAAVSLFYMGGMALNDVADAAVDRVERPGRPIPSGEVAVGAAWVFIGLSFTIGVALLVWVSAWAAALGVALMVCIAAYDFLHKRRPGAVLLMGACRGLIYVVAAVAVSTRVNWRVLGPLAVILAAYTVAITIVARIETRAHMDARKWVAMAMPLVVLGAAAFAVPGDWVWPTVFGVALAGWLGYAAWQVFQAPPRIMQAVLAWLAGMCLVDGYFLALLGRPGLACVGIGCFVVTRLGHRKITGT